MNEQDVRAFYSRMGMEVSAEMDKLPPDSPLKYLVVSVAIEPVPGQKELVARYLTTTSLAPRLNFELCFDCFPKHHEHLEDGQLLSDIEDEVVGQLIAATDEELKDLAATDLMMAPGKTFDLIYSRSTFQELHDEAPLAPPLDTVDAMLVFHFWPAIIKHLHGNFQKIFFLLKGVDPKRPAA